MTGRGVAVQGGLALVGLVATYFTWQREPELQAGEVLALDLSRGDLDQVRFEDRGLKSFAELARDKDALGSFVSLRLSGSDAANAAMPAGRPAVPLKVPERLVRGNESAQRLFERFAPLRASRALGMLDAAKLKEFGLDASKQRIEVAARGARRRFAIVPAPPGGNDPYLRDEQDGRVYVVNRSILSDLQSASVNLVERRLHAFAREEIDRLVLKARGKTKEFRAIRAENQPGIKLAPATAPDKPDETARNWHDRIWNLFPAEVMGKGEVPPQGAPKLAIRIEYSSRGRQLGWLEIARNATTPANESTTDVAPQVAYARSEFTAGWMKLTADAAALISEGEGLSSR